MNVATGMKAAICGYEGDGFESNRRVYAKKVSALYKSVERNITAASNARLENRRRHQKHAIRTSCSNFRIWCQNLSLSGQV